MRPENWPTLLNDYVDAARRTPFAWGTQDCVTFTAGWQTIATGVDNFAPFRGKYDSELSAFRIMHGKGVHTMDEAGDYLFGKRINDVAYAQRGDIVLVEGALGIVVGAKAVCSTREGVVFFDLWKFLCGWKVG